MVPKVWEHSAGTCSSRCRPRCQWLVIRWITATSTNPQRQLHRKRSERESDRSHATTAAARHPHAKPHRSVADSPPIAPPHWTELPGILELSHVDRGGPRHRSPADNLAAPRPKPWHRSRESNATALLTPRDDGADVRRRRSELRAPFRIAGAAEESRCASSRSPLLLSPEPRNGSADTRTSQPHLLRLPARCRGLASVTAFTCGLVTIGRRASLQSGQAPARPVLEGDRAGVRWGSGVRRAAGNGSLRADD